jgi:tRNA threonylcarbamoyladenosine biosynthesis protein TsaB
LRVVGIDTSTFTGGVALIDNGQVVAEYSAYVTRRNSESLMGVLDEMLKDLGWDVRDLQGVAVSIGPGSFTGTRIGVTMAKVLGYSLDIPIGAVVTLDAVAANVPFAELPVCPLICARRDIVYNAVYRVDGPCPRKVGEYNVGKIAEVIDNIKRLGYLENREHDKVMFLGDGAIKHKRVIEERLHEQAVIGPPWYLGPRPGVVAVMGQRQIAAGNVVDARDLVPFYMGKSSAEKAQNERRPEERAKGNGCRNHPDEKGGS